MTIGLPISFAFQASNVADPAPTLNDILLDCQSPIFSTGFEVQSDEWVYEFSGDVNYTPKVWSLAGEDAGYDLDEVIFVPCDATGDMADYAGKLIKVTGRSGAGITTHQRPKEPEEYDGWDSGVDPNQWSHRYVKVSSAATDGWLNRMWFSPSGLRWYYMYWLGANHAGCGDGGWRWSAKDVIHEDPRGGEDYLRTCLRLTYSTKYDAAKDIKADMVLWGSPNRPKESTLQFRSMVERGGHFYFRTTLSIPIEYADYTIGATYQYSYMEVITPADIEGFTQKRRSNTHAPYDGKGYTKAVVDTSLTDGKAVWTLLSTEDFDSIAFGNVICDTIDIKVMDTDGNMLSELRNYIVDNSVSIDSDIDYNSTIVLYMSDMITSESVIEITLNGSTVEIGEILGAKSIDAGFTKVSFKNKFKDFSPKEQDQWGNWYYYEGIKVHVHSGVVEFPLMRYDQLNRLMVLIGGKKVVINSSDSTSNEAPDGLNVFDATMMIARFTSFELDTSEKNKRIGDIAKYTFALEELV